VRQIRYACFASTVSLYTLERSVSTLKLLQEMWRTYEISASVAQMTSPAFIRDNIQLIPLLDIICGAREKRFVKRYKVARRFNRVCIRSVGVIGIRDPRNWSRQRL